MSLVLGLLILVAFVSFAVVSNREGESRASRAFLLAAAVGSSATLGAAFLPPPAPRLVLLGLAVIGAAAMIRCLIPYDVRTNSGGRPANPAGRREGHHVRPRSVAAGLTRVRRLLPDAPRKPGERQPHPSRCPASFHPMPRRPSPLAFAAADACFKVTEALRD